MVFNMPHRFRKKFRDTAEGKHQKASRAPAVRKSISKKIFARNRSQKKFFDASKEEHQEARCTPSEWVGRIGLYAIRGNERMNSYSTLRVKDVLQATKCFARRFGNRNAKSPLGWLPSG